MRVIANKMKKAIVLLSSGLDSLVNTAMAIEDGYTVETITFDYGQRAATKEKEYAARICQFYNIRHTVIDLPWLAAVTATALVKADKQVPEFDPTRFEDNEYQQETAKAVWVPNRNGVFINIAASLAEARQIRNIIVGFNKEEAATFPDNTVEYIDKVNEALAYSTLSKVKVICFTSHMNKREIMNKAKELSVPLDLCWPCYHAGDTLCGVCESCVRFKRAKESNDTSKLSH